MTREKGYSINKMAVEKEIKFNGRLKRFDLMLVGEEGEPMLLCEFKAPQVPIGQKTFDQLAVYNSVLDAKHLLVSNGETHFFASWNELEKSWVFSMKMPAYVDLLP